MNRVRHLTKITPEEMQLHWDNFKSLNGKYTSTMTDYEKRLVDFFTVRYLCDEEGKPAYVRKPTAYVTHLLYGLGIEEHYRTQANCYTELKVYEDMQVAFPRFPFSSKRIHDESFYSIEDKDYKSPRYFKGDKVEFSRIYRKVDKETGEEVFVYLDTSNYGKSEPVFANLPNLGASVDDLKHENVDVVMATASKVSGDEIVTSTGHVIKVTTFLPPYTEHISNPVAASTFAAILCMWSRNNSLEAPHWARQALAYYQSTKDDPETRDTALDSALRNIGFPSIGGENADPVFKRKGITSLGKSKTISIAMTLAQRETDIGRGALPTAPPLGAMDL